MGFQTVVNVELAAGIPGTLYDDGPVRAAPYELNSALASYNVIGATAYTVTSGDPGTNAASGVVAAGGTGAFAGILMNPKVYANVGTSTGPLTSNLTLPNFTIAELLTMGDIWVSLPGPANVGDLVCYDQTTGALSTYPRQVQFTGAMATTGVSHGHGHYGGSDPDRLANRRHRRSRWDVRYRSWNRNRRDRHLSDKCRKYGLHRSHRG